MRFGNGSFDVTPALILKSLASLQLLVAAVALLTRGVHSDRVRNVLAAGPVLLMLLCVNRCKPCLTLSSGSCFTAAQTFWHAYSLRACKELGIELQIVTVALSQQPLCLLGHVLESCVYVTGVRSDRTMCLGTVCPQHLQSPLHLCSGWPVWLQPVRATAGEPHLSVHACAFSVPLFGMHSTL